MGNLDYQFHVLSRMRTISDTHMCLCPHQWTRQEAHLFQATNVSHERVS